ncbi:uncharacterized protein EV422DRAFT_595841 [Fimicolochytrium jonesii]|uniref:uncharacterized protein n=1 Tax=Fimicolochytrium jonesii TaxID=1396493 RepID=UPI0022FEC2C0|nr:uncharacterized protein EV422DRAFT_595841 [Fimicolochytrium jonesii]KAI8820732.1 hypothetical protein EV422DRAFT_595841 [Fimicolochytrium jonesii]
MTPPTHAKMFSVCAECWAVQNPSYEGIDILAHNKRLLLPPGQRSSVRCIRLCPKFGHTVVINSRGIIPFRHGEKAGKDVRGMRLLVADIFLDRVERMDVGGRRGRRGGTLSCAVVGATSSTTVGPLVTSHRHIDLSVGTKLLLLVFKRESGIEETFWKFVALYDKTVLWQMARNKLCTDEDRFERTFNASSRLFEEWDNVGLGSLFFTQGTMSAAVPFEVVRSVLFKGSARIDDVERVWMQMGSIKLKDIAKIRECLVKNHPEPTPPTPPVRIPASTPVSIRTVYLPTPTCTPLGPSVGDEQVGQVGEGQVSYEQVGQVGQEGDEQVGEGQVGEGQVGEVGVEEVGVAELEVVEEEWEAEVTSSSRKRQQHACPIAGPKRRRVGALAELSVQRF